MIPKITKSSNRGMIYILMEFVGSAVNQVPGSTAANTKAKVSQNHTTLMSTINFKPWLKFMFNFEH